MSEASGINRFGPYLVQEKLGGGGMAIVYKALNEQNNQTVALKILRASVAEEPGVADRFKQESTIVNRLRHPHIVPVNNYGVIKGRPFMELQYMPGGTLATRLRQPTDMNSQHTVRLLRHIASALDYAHKQGVVHRDLKLENILLDARSDASLTDFGIARIVDGTRLTKTGSVMGTPMYISPEQARGGDVDSRADLYSLAVIAYALLVGQFPFNGDNPLTVLNQHVSQPPPLPTQRNPALPRSLDVVLLKGLSKRPEERYPTADTFVETLSRAFNDHPTQSTYINLWNSQIKKDAIKPLTPVAQSADDWVNRAMLTKDNAEAIIYLKRALELEPLHSRANRMLFQLEGAKTFKQPQTDALPPFKSEDDLEPLKKVNRKRQRGGWFYLGIIAFVLSSLSATYFVLNVTGSPIVGQINRLLTGKGPVTEINGTPVNDIPNVILTLQPESIKTLTKSVPVADELQPGYMVEYRYAAQAGDELAVGLKFFSPTALDIRSNVVLLTPDGQPALGCTADQPIAGDPSSIAFSCLVTQSGTWKLRIFGVDGESTGAYTVLLESLQP